MHRMERDVVQLSEAQRFADAESSPYARLALLLLDNLAEVLLYREVQHKLHFARMFRNLTESYDEHLGELPPDVERRRKELFQKSVSRNRERKLRRYFDEKADYLVEEGAIEEQHARALKKLHVYRNEAYHQDYVRSETLQTAVDIYFYLCCQLMKSLPLHIISGTFSASKYLRPYLEEEAQPLFDFPAQVAEQMLQQRQMNDIEVNSLLRNHLLSRLQGMRETLDSWTSDSGDTAEELLHNCQVPEEAIQSVADVLNIASFEVPHDFTSLEFWETRAKKIQDSMPVLDAFGLFADIEDEFEELEDQIMRMSAAMDHAIQDEIDRIRGK